MSRFTFKLPDIGEGIAEAEIVAWHVKPGDRIEEDAPLCDVMTDKATVEMESPVSGTVLEVAGKAGDMVPIGSALVVFEVDGEDEEAPPPQYLDVVAEPELQVPVAPAVEAPAPVAAVAPEEKDSTSTSSVRTETGTSRVLASPAVRARAKELGVDLAQVRAEGAHVRHADLDAFLRYGAAQGYGLAAAARPDEAVPVIGMRRRIAENMAASKRAIPHFSYVEEIEVTQLEELRAQLNSGRGDRPKLTLLPLLIAAICKVVPEFPMLNARYDDAAGVVTRHGAVHMGIATQTPAGLMVPVIRDAQARNIWQLAGEIARLAEAARNGTAKREELSGSTLTVTSLGPLGGVATTPVINRPEVAIIGPNRIIERPVFVDGSSDRVRRAKLMNLSISCDHRVVDGWDAASFVQALKRLVEAPALILAG
ncbi:MAG: 2-oxo acid dehydrogenase subunit E2 [Sphingomonadales bacterium]|nr:2-oxo acid dehydrogenase subunit E2 [Sphingomonadales bacterium]